MEFLPDEINSIITSFLVCNKPKNSLDLESYKNLSLVNKEFNKNITKYKIIYKILKNDLILLKKHHSFLFEIIKYEMLRKTELILPTNTNEGCILCGNFLPNWWPKINLSYINNNIVNEKILNEWNSRTNNRIPEGLCGNCNRGTILCKFCSEELNYFIKSPKLLLYNPTGSLCSACINFKKCRWCSNKIHPLKYLDKMNYMSDFCNKKCYEDEQDFQAFAWMER